MSISCECHQNYHLLLQLSLTYLQLNHYFLCRSSMPKVIEIVFEIWLTSVNGTLCLSGHGSCGMCMVSESINQSQFIFWAIRTTKITVLHANTQKYCNFCMSYCSENKFCRQEAFEKCWAHSSLRAAARHITIHQVSLLSRRTLRAHRCPRRRRRRQRVTEGTAMAP